MTSEFPQPQRLPQPVRITEQVWPEGTVPVVSICCITYQHKNFIRDALEGFLMQETTFPVEILIHDDASTDGTADTVGEYEAKYPRLIRMVLQKENQRSQGNRPLKILAPLAHGEFIALCEGDDYWTDSRKLETQIAFLTSRPHISSCFHQTQYVDAEKNIIRRRIFNRPEAEFDLLDCITKLKKGYATCSMAFRKNALVNPKPWFIADNNDMFLELQLAYSGKIAFINKNMGAYRRHGAGIWSSLTDVEQAITLLKRYDLLLDDKHHSEEVRSAIRDARKSQIECLCLKSRCKDVLSESSFFLSSVLRLYGAATRFAEAIRRAARKKQIKTRGSEQNTKGF